MMLTLKKCSSTARKIMVCQNWAQICVFEHIAKPCISFQPRKLHVGGILIAL